MKGKIEAAPSELTYEPCILSDLELKKGKPIVLPTKNLSSSQPKPIVLPSKKPSPSHLNLIASPSKLQTALLSVQSAVLSVQSAVLSVQSAVLSELCIVTPWILSRFLTPFICLWLTFSVQVYPFHSTFGQKPSLLNKLESL